MDASTLERFLAKIAIAENGCWMWQTVKNRDGYGRLRVQGKMVLAHRLAYTHFIGEIPAGIVLLHACNNPGCVNPEHLRRGTQAENIAHCIASGRRARGERNGFAKLTTEDVTLIRTGYASGNFSQRELAETVGVSQSMISRIVRGKKWGHVCATIPWGNSGVLAA